MALKSKKIDFNDQALEEAQHLRLMNQEGNEETKFYYRIENQGLLAQVGRSYSEDYKAGVRNFAFSSMNYKASQQRIILGIASYFDHVYDMKIIIVSDMLERGIFEDIMQEIQVEQKEISECKIQVNKFHHHFDLVDLTKTIADFTKAVPNGKIQPYLKSFFSGYDIVFWDTPVIDTNRNTMKVFTHYAPFIESITFIVSPSVSRAGDLKTLEEYFSNYGINVKGVLFDSFVESAPAPKEEEKGFFKYLSTLKSLLMR